MPAFGRSATVGNIAMRMTKGRLVASPKVRLAWIAWMGLGFCLVAMGQGPVVGDPRAKLVSPSEGQRFAPGDTVNVVARTTTPLAAVYSGVELRGVGVIQLTPDPDRSTFRGSFVIPDDFAGSTTLTISAIDAKGSPLNGQRVTIVVRATGAPLSLTPVQAEYHFRSPGTKGRVYVTGNYPEGVTRDLSSAASGTLYASSDPRVIRVDPEGNVEAVGFGTASVSAVNGSRKTYFTFIVEDSEHWLAPEDLTQRVRFERSALELDDAQSAKQKTPIYWQTVTVTNSSEAPLIGPLHLTIRDFQKKGWLFGFPPGRATYYTRLSPTKDGLTLSPGESVTVTLRFIALPAPTAPDYRLGVIRFLGDTSRLP
jgi:hypothetical protein